MKYSNLALDEANARLVARFGLGAPQLVELSGRYLWKLGRRISLRRSPTVERAEAEAVRVFSPPAPAPAEGHTEATP